MNTPKIRGLGIVQDGLTARWKAMESLQALAAPKSPGDRRVRYDR
jgi:hypothetical protein